MLVLIWEFQVKPGSEADFERAYGPKGSWVKLFSQADGYVRTELVQDAEDGARYLTLDYWRSEESYLRFRKEFKEAFERLDHDCESLTESEKDLGRFSVHE